ncbi:hypothetical protein DW683_07925 [Bacteroides sp. AM25-34]|nr:hypothetical protein F9001_19200 [Phocaeicola vulgatus]RGI03238.1 hypothetical protein DW683_07925 [Bacteroides sp. AM25-34]
MPYSRSPSGKASRLGRKKYRSAKRKDDFFPADPQGPALRSGGERLPLLQRNKCVLFCFLPPAIILLR